MHHEWLVATAILATLRCSVLSIEFLNPVKSDSLSPTSAFQTWNCPLLSKETIRSASTSFVKRARKFESLGVNIFISLQPVAASQTYILSYIRLWVKNFVPDILNEISLISLKLVCCSRYFRCFALRSKTRMQPGLSANKHTSMFEAVQNAKEIKLLLHSCSNITLLLTASQNLIFRFLVDVTTRTTLGGRGLTVCPSAPCTGRFLFLVTVVAGSFPFPVVAPVAPTSALPSWDASSGDCASDDNGKEFADEDKAEVDKEDEDEDEDEDVDDDEDENEGNLNEENDEEDNDFEDMAAMGGQD
jgi:hypothetical protein